MKIRIVAGLLLSVLVAQASVKHEDFGAKGVLCLTFDDRGFDGWTDSIPLFAEYGAHATFFAMGELGTNECAKLKRLAAAGHTIGVHTRNHRVVPDGYAQEGMWTFWRRELKPQFAALKSVGITPRFFAYPMSRRTDDTDAQLTRSFQRLRSGVKTLDQAIFPASELPQHRVMAGKGVGERYHTDINELKRTIRRLAERDEVLTLYSHNIASDAKGNNMKTEWLRQILATAKECGVAVKGFGELGEVAPAKPTEPLRIALTFDDNIKDHLLIAAPELEKRGWRGTFNVVPTWVGSQKKTPMMNWDDVRELVKRGHEVENHSMNHVGLGRLAESGKLDQLSYEITNATAVIERETGVRPRFLCLPGTSGDGKVTEIANASGLQVMLLARYCFGEWNKDVAECIRSLRSYGIRRADFLVHGIRPEGGGWKPFPSKEAFIDYLDVLKAAEQRGEIVIVPYSQL